MNNTLIVTAKRERRKNTVDKKIDTYIVITTTNT